MRIVVALGGNALLRRGVPLTMANQEDSIARAVRGLSTLIHDHDVVISHGNGPQVGLLALQADAYDHDGSFPFDVLGAETEGMIGYLLEKELRNHLDDTRAIATIVTMTEVDLNDPAFAKPSKFIGPVYTDAEAHSLAIKNGWTVKADGTYWRRVVPSPRPMRILELTPVEWLLERGVVVICAGGGGIPTMYLPDGTRTLVGVEAVIDKDFASELLARELEADLFIMATDVDGVYLDWGKPEQRIMSRVTSAELKAQSFPAGSMGPKVQAARQFVEQTGKRAAIGSLEQIAQIVAGAAGTNVVAS